MKNYRLDPCNYYTTPGLTGDAGLMKTDVKLELLSDMDKMLFCEKGLRGGISMISKRYCKANNKYLPDYDSTKTTKHILHLDANNLYGWAMSQPLPTGNFNFEKNVELFTTEYIQSIPDESIKGYFLEVDIETPEELHEYFNSYPLAPEQIAIQRDMLSTYQLEIYEKLNGKKVSKTNKIKKLIPNLLPKKNYMIHYRLLKLYLQLGMKLTKVHRVLSYD